MPSHPIAWERQHALEQRRNLPITAPDNPAPAPVASPEVKGSKAGQAATSVPRPIPAAVSQ